MRLRPPIRHRPPRQLRRLNSQPLNLVLQFGQLNAGHDSFVLERVVFVGEDVVGLIGCIEVAFEVADARAGVAKGFLEAVDSSGPIRYRDRSVSLILRSLTARD